MGEQPSNLEIREERSGLTIVFKGRLPREDVAGALAQADDGLQASSGAVVLDLSALSELDDYALAVAAAVYRRGQHGARHVTFEDGADGTLADLVVKLATAQDRPKQEFNVVSVPVQVGEHALHFWHDMRALIEFAGELTYALYQGFRHPRRVRWRDVVKYMDRCGSDGLPIVLLICFLMGLILGFQAALQLQMFGADIYAADLVGLSICRELGPLMVATICTGRAGSAFAAEIGTMKVSEEVDALVTMGLEPNRFLVVPKVVALMAVMPLLTVFGDVAGIAGGFTVAVLQMDLPFLAYWNQTVSALDQWDIVQGLIKSVVFGLFIAAVGCLRGLQTRGGAQGVGVSTTSAVVSGIFLIIILDAAMTIMFARLGLGM